MFNRAAQEESFKKTEPSGMNMNSYSWRTMDATPRLIPALAPASKNKETTDAF
jgi:hypothetical protein